MRPLTAILPCALASAVLGQAQWTTAHVAPAGNLDVRLCYHAADGRVVAVRARQDSPDFETWEWDGARWYQRTPAQSPPIRQGYALAYDSARRVVVLFGGVDPSWVHLSDTWEWDGLVWTQRQPAAAPAGRHSMAMAYDARRQRVLVYGGRTESATLADLWEWDGASWTQVLAGATWPGPRAGSVMTYDAARRVAVMFGGIGLGIAYQNDVWEYDGARWARSAPTPRPPGVRNPSIAFDSRAGRTVVFGGDVRGVPSTDVWEWDGAQWRSTAAAVTPGACLSAGLAFDERRDRIVLHGGKYETETWTWDRAAAAWSRAAYDAPRPIASALAAYDWAGRTLYVAGFDTFEWDHVALAWRRRATTSQPSPFLLGALTFDRVRRQGVLFGGEAGGPAETWIWEEPRATGSGDRRPSPHLRRSTARWPTT